MSRPLDGREPLSATEGVDEPVSATDGVDESMSATDGADELLSATDGADEPSAADGVDEPVSATDRADEPWGDPADGQGTRSGADRPVPAALGATEADDELRRERVLVARAVDGDRTALEEVVRLIQDPLYRLALRMVWRPADAEDALQEILVRVITRLATWRAEARLLTWAYRVGVNYLLNLRRQTPQEARGLSLEEFREDLTDGLATADYAGPEAELLAQEVRLTCSQAMLQCLERTERVAFVLGEIFELPSGEAAWIAGTTPAGFRKRLERARRRIRAFMGSTCGLADPKAFCRCARRVEKAVAVGRVDPRRPALATHPVAPGGRQLADTAGQLHRLRDAAAVLRAHPDYAAPQARTDAVLALLGSGRFPLLD
ncbi:RNA polymerase sigma factor [Streptomyces sp. NPDC018031]|uniref:RNA polymerase sigma factor n=1 Tax=Streptomyces sp. NPDC018031 TaxID=3365033 RepID=UPI0037BBA686